MAKGKQATAAANRRLAAANERIDRLTNDLVDAKSRARQYEDEAIRAGVLDIEIVRLRQQLDIGTNDRIEELNTHHDAKVADLEERINGLASLLKAVLDRVDGKMTWDEWENFRRYYGKDLTQWAPDEFFSRNHRRNTATTGAMSRAGRRG